MTNYGKIFDYELKNWLIDESGFKQSQCQMFIYYKYATYVSKLVMLSYVDDYVYWYNSKELGKWFLDTIGKRFNMTFLGYLHWFISIRISQIKDQYTSVDQARYAKSFV